MKYLYLTNYDTHMRVEGKLVYYFHLKNCGCMFAKLSDDVKRLIEERLNYL